MTTEDDSAALTDEVATVAVRPATVGAVRTSLGFALGSALLAGLTVFLVNNRSSISVATALALYLLLVVAVTAVGGPWPGVVSAVMSPVLVNWFLIPPYYTFRINDSDNLLELLVFVSTATIVSSYVSIAARRAAEAEQAREETYALAREQRRLRRIALEAEMLAKADELRTAILRAVSHDLRTPLAGIKASVSSLRQDDVEWPDEDRDQFLESIEDETDRLTSIVTNLLDLSRLEAGVLRPHMSDISLDEVIPTTIRSMPGTADRLAVRIPADLPDVIADHALLERVLFNLVQNALKWSPVDESVRVECLEDGGNVRIVVSDRGPGIPTGNRAAVLQPFHRLDDTSSGGGIGLGLAIADRLVAAMDGRLELRDTPGGGLSAEVVLVRAGRGPA